MSSGRLVRWIAAALVAAGIVIPGPVSIAGTDHGDRRPPAPIRHLILFIGDGMQMAHEVAAARYLYPVDRHRRPRHQWHAAR